MMRFLRRLLGRKTATPRVPESMFDLRPADPCWCGSEKPYGKCHRRADRRALAEALGQKGPMVEALT